MPIGKPMKKGLRDKILERDGGLCVRRHETPYTCKGRMNTMEHAFARKNEEEWNTLTMCAYHAGVDQHSDRKGFNKEINRYYAYKNISDEELAKKKLGKQYLQEKKYLTEKYGDKS